jgi:zinc transport system substrate-binding protein
LIRENNITSVISDPQSRSEWVELVRDGTDANTALADPLGAAYPRGADHYAATIRGLADAYATCLGGSE